MMTDANARELGRASRTAGYAISSNPFNKTAWEVCKKTGGARLVPRYPVWAHWQALWNSGWLERNKELT